MKKTNDTYCIVFKGKNITERYYRDKDGWLKVSNRDRVFRATAEQVLNHLLPALAFSDKLGLTVKIEHYEEPYWQTLEFEKRLKIPEDKVKSIRKSVGAPAELEDEEAMAMVYSSDKLSNTPK